MNYSIRNFYFFFIISAISVQVKATRPCPTPECTTASECNKVAKWIAIGTIKEVVNSPEGEPLNKNFAKWERRSTSAPKEMKFSVGWCNNRQELPADTAGKFRFYGITPPETAQYIFFEKL